MRLASFRKSIVNYDKKYIIKLSFIYVIGKFLKRKHYQIHRVGQKTKIYYVYLWRGYKTGRPNGMVVLFFVV